jgi:aspartate dehydrogenase
MTSSTRIGLIGFGAIGRTLAGAIGAHADLAVVGVLERAELVESIASEMPGGVHVVTSADDLLGLGPDIVVECAGHQALRQHGEKVLQGGVDLLVASVGALADASLEERLRNAVGVRARVLVPAGAIAGLDALGAARYAGLDRVDYTGRKAPKAWRGTAAERLVDLETVAEARVFFESDARTTALEFPQNANVVAAVALAGIGFEKTRVRLMVDPAVTTNRHRVEASGAFGEIAVEVTARTLPQNPKTSMLAPYSLVRTLRNRAAAIVV